MDPVMLNKLQRQKIIKVLMSLSANFHRI